MNYISKLDYLGFIPKKGETEEKFMERAEKWMSLEDKIENWASKKGYCVLDNTKAVELIYENTLTKPTWVPLIEVKYSIEELLGLPTTDAPLLGCSEYIKINGVKIPGAFVRPKVSLSLKEHEMIDAHEILHAIRMILTSYNFFSQLLNLREVITEEMIADIVQQGEKKYSFPTFYNNNEKTKSAFKGGILISVSTALTVYSLIGTPVFAIVALPLFFGGGCFIYSLIQRFRAGNLAEHLKDLLPNLEKEFPDKKLGYLMLRTKPTELVKIAKNPDYINKIQGLRGEIIRKYL